MGAAVSDILMRIELHTAEQGHLALSRHAWPWAKEQLGQGRELVAEFRLLDDAITDAQRGYLHGVVLTEIAQFCTANGEKFPMPVWKEYFRDKYLGFKVVTHIDPFTRRKLRRRVRVSTEDLGVRRLAAYIDEVIAFAATDLNYQVSEPLPPPMRPERRKAKNETIDAETGEILQAA
jgi:hypothetical protein